MRWYLRLAAGAAVVLALSCSSNGRDGAPPKGVASTNPSAATAPDQTRAARDRMVREQIEARGVRDPSVLAAMRQVPRDRFVPPEARVRAYDDQPLSIGYGQTVSQPYIVALMTELARIRPGARVLEIGTGSGYQAAVLDAMGAEVWSIEIVEPLAAEAEERLRALGYGRVTVRHGDGYAGWPEHAPFDAILLTAAPPEIPEPLLAQLAPGGRLVAPVGRVLQDLVVVTAGPDGFKSEEIAPVRFVPMTGRVRDGPWD